MSESSDAPVRRRRPRYKGKNPRQFEEKYKEHAPEKYPETVAKVLAAGKTPAGSHVPILSDAILEALQPAPGKIFVDCTLGYGGHAEKILSRLIPGGCLIGLDVDPLEQPRTEARLRTTGYGAEVFRTHRCNFAGILQVLARESLSLVDGVLADLGLSSMQIDNPKRGFSVKTAGPLDMRMNPNRGEPASALLQKLSPLQLERLLVENADEPMAALLAHVLAGQCLATTTDLAETISRALVDHPLEETNKSIRRVFQALRIAVNEEFSALDTLLRSLPYCLKPGGRVAVLTFHSGEDRRVKKAFQEGYRSGIYAAIARDVVRADPDECRRNPRATSAKLRWAVRSES